MEKESEYPSTPIYPTKDEIKKYIEGCKFPLIGDVAKYDKIAKIGQGTFGEVFKAKHKETGEIVALKKVLMENEKEGFPITALREIRILEKVHHENMVRLLELCKTQACRSNDFKSTFYLVFEFCDHDLAGILANKSIKFSLEEIKSIMKQLLTGLFYIHRSKILHRDIKAANILLTKNGIVKIADFGLARAISIKPSKPNRYTNRVVTLWYRPPELLLGERNYGPPIDLWGAGCILAELWTRCPILQGNTEQMQLKLIVQLCGSINTTVWPDVDQLELYHKMKLPKNEERKLIEKLRPFIHCPYACDLVDKMLTLDPARRIDCHHSLDHEFFWTDPMPGDLSELMSKYHQSMFEFLTPAKKASMAQQRNNNLNNNVNNVNNRVVLPTTESINLDSGYVDRVF